jgi:hypothetical protein
MIAERLVGLEPVSNRAGLSATFAALAGHCLWRLRRTDGKPAGKGAAGAPFANRFRCCHQPCLLKDPLCLGLRQERARGDDHTSFVDVGAAQDTCTVADPAGAAARAKELRRGDRDNAGGTPSEDRIEDRGRKTPNAPAVKALFVSGG